MKTKTCFTSCRCAPLLGVTLALMPAVAAFAQSPSEGISRHNVAPARATAVPPAPDAVTFVRASDYVGAQVVANDGRTVGRVSDFVFDTSSAAPQLYVLVESGGFLGYGGGVRAVPARALVASGGSLRLGIGSDQFERAPVLPQDRTTYLADPQNTDDLARAFGLTNSPAPAPSDDTSRLLSYSRIDSTYIYGRGDQRLGKVVDAWVGFGRTTVPYVEIAAPSPDPFEEAQQSGYAIPVSMLRAQSHDGEIEANLTLNSLYASSRVGGQEVRKVGSDGGTGPESLQIETRPM